MGYQAMVMVLAGVGIPVLAALNARLGANIGSPAAAALVLFPGGLLRDGGGGSDDRHGGVFAHGGAARAPVPGGAVRGVLRAARSPMWRRPSGWGTRVFFVLLGQLVSAALIDHFGLFGARVTEVTPMRLAGIVVMGLGIALTQFAGRG